MSKELLSPDYIFESSWEVCNKVGGIYTVLSTRAKTLQERFHDRIIFIGPDFWKQKESPYFLEEKTFLAEWQGEAREQGLKVRVGRWTVPGEPIAILVDFNPYFEQKNEIYGWLWENYGVDSLHAYGDYDEASMFSYAAALVVESLYHWLSAKRLEFSDVSFETSKVKSLNSQPSTSFKRHIKPLHRVRQGTDGDKVNALLGIVADGVEGDATRRLGLEAVVDNVDSLLGVWHREVVEHDTVDTAVIEHLLQLVERAHLNLNLQVETFLLEVLVATVDGIDNTA